MIWNSVFMMTVVDLLIVGVAGYGLAFFLRSRRRAAKRHAIRGMGAIIVGLCVIGGFYFADLLIMHALPLFVPSARAMAVMTEMHLNFQWLASLGGVGLIGFGLVVTVRQMFALVDRAETSETQTRHELALREETESALRESEASLANAQRIAGLGRWDLDLVTGELVWSPEVFRILRIAEEEFDGTAQAYYDRLHPSDRAFVRRHLEAAKYEGQPYDIDHRIVLPDGELRYLHEQAEVIFDEAGKPVRLSGTTHDITDRKRAEEAMWRSEARLTNAQRIARLGNWDWDIESDEVWWSDEIYRVFGVAPGQIEASYSGFLGLVHEDDRAEFGKVVGTALREGTPYGFDHRIVRPDGEVRFVHQQAEAVLDDDGNPARMAGVVHDVTDAKRAEENLRKSEARLAGILDIAPEAIISIDRSGRVQLFNQGAESIFGYDSGEVLGQPIELLMPSAHREHHAALVEDFDRAPEASRLMSRRGEIAGLRKDGSEFPADASVSKLDLGGDVLFTVLLRDITERKAAEGAILKGKEEAEIANRAKSEFLANMSHELRTPLNAIIGFAEIIMTEVLGPVGNAKYCDYAKDINESGQHLLEIINDILDLSKIETGQVALREEKIDVPAAVRSCLKLINERAKSAGVDLIVDFSAESYPLLYADLRMVKQILVNLLSNAVKFTPRGGRVTVTAVCDPKAGYTLEIADTGIGIAPDDITKALARFEQVDARLDRRFEGTGLGLPLSKAFAELHGGSLELESEVGVGTRVLVRFPPERMLPAKPAKPIAREAS